VTIGDDGMNFPITTALNVYANVSSDYVAKIDNDQSSAGHVLKLSTDGNGSGSRFLEMVDGDGDTLFRARADGRFGFGPTGVSSMGAGTFVVGIDGGHSSDIAISKRMQHLGDSDTYMDFPAADQIQFVAGGVDILHVTENDSQDVIVFNEGGADLDLRVESDDLTHAVFVDAGNNKVLLGDSAAGTDVFFYVSGAMYDDHFGDKGGVAVFDGDLLVSRSLCLYGTGDHHEFSFGDLPGEIGQDVRFAVSGSRNPWTGGSGIANPRVAAFTGDVAVSGAICGKGSYYGGTAHTLKLVGGNGNGLINNVAGAIQMESFAATSGPRGDDIFLSVSGAIGGKLQQNSASVTVFGGDMVVSGALHGSTMGANIPKTAVTHNADSALTQNTRSGHITLTTDGAIANAAMGSTFQVNSGYISETDVITCTTDTQGIFALASDVGTGNFKIVIWNASGGTLNDDATVHVNWLAL